MFSLCVTTLRSLPAPISLSAQRLQHQTTPARPRSPSASGLLTQSLASIPPSVTSPSSLHWCLTTCPHRSHRQLDKLKTLKLDNNQLRRLVLVNEGGGGGGRNGVDLSIGGAVSGGERGRQLESPLAKLTTQVGC